MPLEEVCSVEYGTRVVQKRDGGSVYPVYGGGGATFKMDEFNREDRLVIARFGMSEECTRFVAGKFFLNDSGLTVSPKNGAMLQRFLDYQMLSLNDDIYALGKGTAQKNLDVPVFRTLPLFLPTDIPEQQRIVDILDKAFEGIVKARAHAEKNLQNARALFESYLQSVFTQRGPGWVEKPLVSLCSLFVDSAHRTPKYQIEGIPALRPRDVVNGKLALGEAARVSVKEYEIQSRRHRPAPGDIVYSRELSYGWAVALPEMPRICLSQGMCLFRPVPNLDSAFLLYVLNSPVGREQALRAAVGAAHPHINLGDIKAYKIPFPANQKEQREIISKLDDLRPETQRLESIYTQKLVALDALKKSLLHQAFTGKL